MAFCQVGGRLYVFMNEDKGSDPLPLLGPSTYASRPLHISGSSQEILFTISGQSHVCDPQGGPQSLYAKFRVCL
jgi:hypothetical protein